MSATELARSSAAQEARRAIGVVPTAQRASIIAGAFADVEGATAVIRAVRSAGSTEDIVGIALPLAGDPHSPDALETLLPQARKRKFNLGRWLMTVIDPHQPPPDYQRLTKGRNSILARPLLGEIAEWLVGVQEFRVPDPNSPDGGVWVLGRPNHAAAVSGAAGAALGGAVGALAALGLPEEHMQDYIGRLFQGQTILTLCETDDGRTKRDYNLMGRHGALHRFVAAGLHAPDRGQA